MALYPRAIARDEPLVYWVIDAETNTRLWSALMRAASARRRATLVFDVVEAALPKRLRHEELGDALEFINRVDRSSAKIYTKIATTLIWLAINAAREVMSVAWGRATK
jgi:hypothetical protein